MDQAPLHLPVKLAVHFVRFGNSVILYPLERLQDHVLLRLAIHKPKLRRLLVVVAVRGAVAVYEQRLDRKVRGEVMRLRVGIFNNEPPPPPLYETANSLQHKVYRV